MNYPKANPVELLPLGEYDRIIVGYSGGKDSTAAVLHLLELGADPDKMELWHQEVDGREGAPLMDWPCTPGYCRAFATHLGLPRRCQWKMGGFARELLRKDSKTAPVRFELTDGTIGEAGGVRGQQSTRRKFPQLSADLSVRWCSAYLKIDVAALAINHDPNLAGTRILIVTGERRQESAARSQYAEVAAHRCQTRRRLVHHWRAVLDFSEAGVWSIIRRHGIRVHPAYYLGWGRVSCLLCIFGDHDQMSSARQLVPEQFSRVAQHEADFGVTIRKGLTVIEAADQGTPYPTLELEPYRSLALAHEYPVALITFAPEEWEQPAGAYTRCGGPT